MSSAYSRIGKSPSAIALVLCDGLLQAVAERRPQREGFKGLVEATVDRLRIARWVVGHSLLLALLLAFIVPVAFEVDVPVWLTVLLPLVTGALGLLVCFVRLRRTEQVSPIGELELEERAVVDANLAQLNAALVGLRHEGHELPLVDGTERSLAAIAAQAEAVRRKLREIP